MDMMMKKFKMIISVISFLSAIVIGFIAMFIPPEGIIDSSILWFSAQLLVFTSTILGFDYHVFTSRKDLQPNT